MATVSGPFFTPRLKLLELRGDELEPGDHVQVYRHQAAVVVDRLWCARFSGSGEWDVRGIHFKARGFPYFQYSVGASMRFPVHRAGVYTEGWSPQECAARKAAWEKEQGHGEQDDG
ncbi:hypothetical protein AB0A05_27195 [Streptomyces sp. NPDC046374]|uniref:hypothetical protein n=1 Tax=Streptomyces sp. NPDC046374 TaxID=3154917 RepID=UPI0033FB26A7